MTTKHGQTLHPIVHTLENSPFSSNSIAPYVSTIRYCTNTGVLISPQPDPTEKTIERSPFFVRRGCHCCRGDLVGRTTFWIIFEWLAEVRVWTPYLVSFLVGVRTYQHPGKNFIVRTVEPYPKSFKGQYLNTCCYSTGELFNLVGYNCHFLSFL